MTAKRTRHLSRGKVFTAGFLASADPQVETTLYAEPGTYLLVWAKAVDAPLKAYATHQEAPNNAMEVCSNIPLRRNAAREPLTSARGPGQQKHLRSGACRRGGAVRSRRCMKGGCRGPSFDWHLPLASSTDSFTGAPRRTRRLLRVMRGDPNSSIPCRDHRSRSR